MRVHSLAHRLNSVENENALSFTLNKVGSPINMPHM